jgi:Domain of unknown function (DUF4082)/Matrixin
MSRAARLTHLATALLLALGWPAPSQAFRMMSNPGSGWMSSAYAVSCSESGGFMHWNTRSIYWYLNTAGQGAGKEAAVQQAMAAWNDVTTSDYSLIYAGTWSGGFMQNDGHNTISWSTDSSNACVNRSCGGLTAVLLLAPTTTPNGQTILEADIQLNSEFQWMTDGQYSPTCWEPSTGTIMMDTQGVATHELGHTLGIHHPTNAGANPPGLDTPTMDVNNGCTANARTLEGDDVAALQCTENRYPCNPYYQGEFETASCSNISGWAWNANRYYFPSYVEIVDNLSNGTARILNVQAANQYRGDLVRRGIGDGQHGFSYNASGNYLLYDAQWHSISVRHTGTAGELVGSRKDLICGLNLFPDSMFPATYLSTGGLQYEVATQFQSSRDGYITDLGYFFAPGEGDAGTHIIRLWSDSGALLASAYINPPNSFGRYGWNYATLSCKVWIWGGALYRVSINTYYSQAKSPCGQTNSLQSPYVNPPLTAVQGFWDAGNGVFPNTGSCSNFFVSARYES